MKSFEQIIEYFDFKKINIYNDIVYYALESDKTYIIRKLYTQFEIYISSELPLNLNLDKFSKHIAFNKKHEILMFCDISELFSILNTLLKNKIRKQKLKNIYNYKK